jgi:ThiF family
MIPPETVGPITIVGLGGVGSRVAEGLVRLGCGTHLSPINMFDPDTFEEKNIKNQLVTSQYVGEKKVLAVAMQLWSINPKLSLETFEHEVNRHVMLETPIVILCLDSMNARREIIEHCLSPTVRCVIETRMDSEAGMSFCFDPRIRRHWEAWWLYWHSDDETENKAGCSGTSPVISAIFGTACLALKQFEGYLKHNGSAEGIPNYCYTSFDEGYMKIARWPS